MSGYVVIEFIEGGGGVAAVQVSWLVLLEGQLKCYWPKKNAVKAAQMQMSVRGDWSLFSARKISKHNKIYKHYDSCLMEKVRKATVTSAIDTGDHSDMEYGKRCKVAPKVKKSHPGRETKSSAPSMPVAPPYPVATRQPSLHRKVTAPLPSGEITSKQPLSLTGSLTEIQTVAEVHTQPVSFSRSFMKSQLLQSLTSC